MKCFTILSNADYSHMSVHNKTISVYSFLSTAAKHPSVSSQIYHQRKKKTTHEICHQIDLIKITALEYDNSRLINTLTVKYCFCNSVNYQD